MSGDPVAVSADRGRPPASRGRRGEVLGVLREAPSSWSIAEIAARLGVHPNTARFHLDVLVGSGQVERVTTERSGPGRPPLRFRAVPGMDPAGPRRYRLLAGILASGLVSGPDPVGSATAAGRVWGARLAGPEGARPATATRAVDQLVTMLDDLDFAPEPPSRPDGDRIGLRHCPFLELARGQEQVVCQAHLGLMQGALTEMDAPVTVDVLTPFVEPNLCVAHLGPARAALPGS